LLTPGNKIPELSLKTKDAEAFTNADLAGKRALLCFYPAAFSGVCTHQFGEYQERIDDFRARGVEVYAISVDGHHSQRVFQEHLGAFDVTFLADFHPKGAMAQAFGIYMDEAGISNRAVFLVDPDGNVQWSVEMPTPAEHPTADEVLAAIDGVS
jgi:peroxiredoxin